VSHDLPQCGAGAAGSMLNAISALGRRARRDRITLLKLHFFRNRVDNSRGQPACRQGPAIAEATRAGLVRPVTPPCGARCACRKSSARPRA
jgi:hypothetical protein